MTLARVVRGAPRNIGGATPVLRDGRWITDTRAEVGDVYVLVDPTDLVRWGAKLEEVDPKTVPALPQERSEAKVGAESEEAEGALGGTATNEADDPGSVPASVVDVELYRIGDSTLYELPSGEVVDGADAARRALGLEEA